MFSDYTYYFSGSQVGVFIRNVLIDELNTIAFGVQQPLVPRYHYTDVLPRRTVRGRKVVTGEVIINYVHPMYLLLYLKGESDAVAEMERSDITTIGTHLDDHSTGMKQLHESVADRLNTATVNDFTVGTLPVNFQERERYGRLSSAWNVGGQTLEKEIRELEERYWGSGSDTNDAVTSNETIDNMPEVDLVLKIGEPEAQHVHVIRRVKFTGPRVQIAPTGEPIAEVYQFVGRNFV